MKNVIYIGFVAPEELLIENKMHLATNNFEMEFISKGLKCYLSNDSLKIYSYTYNLLREENRQSFRQCNFEIITENAHIDIIALPFVKAPLGISQILRSFCILKNLNYLLKKDRNAIIITCNAYAVFSVPVLILQKIYKCKSIAVMLDAFKDEHTQNFIGKIYVRFSKWLLRQYTGAVGMCENLLNDFCNPNQKKLVILPTDTENNYEKKRSFDPANIKILFAGGLERQNGIIESISALEFLGEEFQLDLYGIGTLKDYVLEAAGGDSRIKYGGIVSRKQCLQNEVDSDILIIIRTEKDTGTVNLARYGMSYKLMEYLLSGIPVVATYIEAIPPSFIPYLNLCKSDAESIAKKIQYVAENYNECLKKAKEARLLIKESCSWDVCETAVREYIEEI
ncbi:glycosyltransferase family protein [Aminipila terrae]|uniref:Glycosyltransferase n=1 Tax=Aminipila terrae TaxID=2697030 RepID=A0A6P1MJB0_9FIRM|nr:glycosyltransferase [Aminipila terrae]QHI72088.1 glycosyltransferase [Aminipila terrae]